MNRRELKQYLEDRAVFHGFTQVAIAKAEPMDEEARRLENWLNQKHQGNMDYLEDHFDLRTDPTKLVPGAKSVISLLYNYYPEETLPMEGNYKIARYAYGSDYHRFMKKKLVKLFKDLESKVGAINGRVFVDSAPVLERDWAKRAGQGWIGKNSLLINKQQGSYFLLAEIISDLEFEYGHPISDYCGSCTKCIDACPTDAIADTGYIVDASKCISYLTIELKEKIPETFKGKMEDWIFGCDICQEVCPWNRFSKPHQEPRFLPPSLLRSMERSDWEELTEIVFDAITEDGSPLNRPAFEGIKRNIQFIQDYDGK